MTKLQVSHSGHFNLHATHRAPPPPPEAYVSTDEAAAIDQISLPMPPSPFLGMPSISIDVVLDATAISDPVDTPEDVTTPEEIAPEEIAEVVTTPEEIAPEEIAEVAPEEIAPEDVTTHEETAPEEIAPEVVTPPEVAPEEIAEVAPPELIPAAVATTFTGTSPISAQRRCASQDPMKWLMHHNRRRHSPA